MSQPLRIERIGEATLYLGDCLEILPALGPVDAVVTDPPWPMSSKEIMQGNLNATELWSSVAPLLKARRILVWHAIHNDPRVFLNPLKNWPYLRALYIRRAIPGYYGRVLLDGEIIHALGEWPATRKGRMVIPGGMSITYVKADRPEGHPGPRSLIATKWIVYWWSDPEDLILDPFTGSGTTGVACADLGRRFIGIEIEPRYFDIACRRIRDAYAQPRLPLEEKPPIIQGKLNV